jgi:transcriptional regulator with XRE-family HTH domain
MTVRFKMTNRGEVAILPRKDYEALAAKAQEADEDIGTVRLVARALKEIVAGTPLIPKEIVDRIIPGENALRVLREWRGKTQLDISYKTNIGQGYISDPESGRRKGTTAAFKKIADVLKVPIDPYRLSRRENSTAQFDHQIKAPQPNWSERGRRRCASSMGPRRPIGPLGKR